MDLIIDTIESRNVPTGAWRAASSFFKSLLGEDLPIHAGKQNVGDAPCLNFRLKINRALLP